MTAVVLYLFLLLSPPDKGHESGDETGDEDCDDADGKDAFRQEGAEDEQQSGQEEASASQTVGFAPDFITGERPWRLDAHVEIALELGHEIPDDDEQDADAKRDDHGDGNRAGTQRLGDHNPVDHQQEEFHQDAEQIVKAAELLIILPAGVDLRKHIEHDGEQKPHAGGDKDRIPAAIGDGPVHIPVGRDLLRQGRTENGCQQDACQSQHIGKDAQFTVFHGRILLSQSLSGTSSSSECHPVQ